MNPIDFKESNKKFTKPANMTDEQCLPLPAWHGKDLDGFDVIISCWKPTEEELKQINETGVIWLSVVGKVTPPVCLMSQSPFIPVKQEETK